MSSTTVIVLALMLCVAVGIGAYVYIQTSQEDQAHIKNGETINHLRGELRTLTADHNALNTRFFSLADKHTEMLKEYIVLKAAIDWMKNEISRPQTMIVKVPDGIKLVSNRRVAKKKTVKKVPKKAPVRKKKAVKKKAKKASSRTVKKIQSQLSQLSH